MGTGGSPATVSKPPFSIVGLAGIGQNLAARLGLAGHRHEQRRLQGLGHHLAVGLLQQIERLLVSLAAGDDHAAAFLELFDQGGRDFFGRAGDDDLVERGVFGPALIAVADLDVDVVVVQPFERLRGLAAERFDDFDRVDVADELREDGRLIAAAGADFQHLVGRLRVEGFGHVGHDERRRDGLAFADGQRHVVVGVSFARGRA